MKTSFLRIVMAGSDMDTDALDNLPPMFRDFFEDWLGRRGSASSHGRRRAVPKKTIPNPGPKETSKPKETSEPH